MPRIRTIKPEFWTSAQVMACQPLTRLLFIGLWNFCDDTGRMPLQPLSIKAKIFPGDEISAANIRRALDELSTNGLLLLYHNSGKDYLQVTGWKAHQKIDRPNPTACPDPENSGSSIIRRTVVDHSPPEGSKKERKKDTNTTGSECVVEGGVGETIPRAGARARTQLPADFALNEVMRSYAHAHSYSPHQINAMFDAFCNHHRAHGNTMADWPAAWRTWVTNEGKFHRNTPPGRPKHDSPVAAVDRILGITPESDTGGDPGSDQTNLLKLPGR